MRLVEALIGELKESGLAHVIISDPEAVASAQENVGEFQRTVSVILKPRTKAEVQTIVATANRVKIALHVFSRGSNWGYGSKLPAGNEEILVSLELLNRIVAIDEVLGVATIEPGVTQGALAAELKRRGCAFHLDVTGSGANTSIVGNALERGVAYQGLRVDQVVSIEVLLGNGKILRTGFGGFPDPLLSGLYSHGLGPSLLGLFFQSNLGIVLELQIQLQCNPPQLHAISLSVKEAQLAPLFEKLILLKQQGCLHGIPHIADRERLRSTLIPLLQDKAEGATLSLSEASAVIDRVVQGEWTLTAAVQGTPKIAWAKLCEAKRSLKSFGRIFVHSEPETYFSQMRNQLLLKFLATREQRALLAAAKELRGFHHGRASDAGIRFLQTPQAANIDQGEKGFLLATPLAPLMPENAILLRDIARAAAKSHQVEIAMTLNIISERVLEAVISVHFVRCEKPEIARAHAFIADVTQQFYAKGLYPYRINIEQMAKKSPLPLAQAEAIELIRHAFDPNRVLSPSRYI